MSDIKNPSGYIPRSLIGVPNGVAPLDGDGLIPEEFLPEISSVPGTPDESIQYNDGGVFAGDAGFTYNKTTNVATIGGVILSSQTASRLAIFDSSKNIVSADTATYPSLSELAFVKGVSGAIQTQLGNKQATLVSGTNIKTINGVTLLGSGDIAISASPAGSDTQVQYNNAGAFGADSLFTFNGDALGIGTATPRSSRLGISAPSIAGAVAGTGTLAPSQIFDDGIVTGTGTLFLSEVEKGDLLMNNADNLAGMVTRVVSDTQLWYVGLGVGFFGGAYKIVKGVASVRDSSGNISWVEASPTSYNEQSGAMNYGGRIFSGGYTMFANNSVPNSGIIIKNQSADGQMRIKHIQSGAYLNFQPSGANITASGLTIAGNSTWASPLYLGMDNYAGGQTGLYIDRTGTGTGQTMYLTTRIYAINGASPKLELSANGIDFGRRDGSTWNETIDAITLSMDQASGFWHFGDHGTTTPTAVSSRVTITDTTRTLRQRYDVSNYFDTAINSTGGVTFDAVGSGAGFTFSDEIKLTQTVTTEVVLSDTTVTMVINGTTYKILARA